MAFLKSIEKVRKNNENIETIGGTLMNSVTMNVLMHVGAEAFAKEVSVRNCPFTQGNSRECWLRGWYNAARACNIVTKAKCSTEHLCLTCDCEYPECEPETATMEFGDGMGGDNVIACGTYVSRKGRK